MVVYDWVFITTFKAIRWCFELGHHNGATIFGIIEIKFAMKSLQLTQNRLLRAIINTKVKDKISIKSMLSKFGLLSVNQLAAQIKLTEVWKSIHVENYAITLAPYNEYQILPDITLRPRLNRVFNDSSRLKVAAHSFNVDAARLWNQAPDQITNARTLSEAKSTILKHVKTLPV